MVDTVIVMLAILVGVVLAHVAPYVRKRLEGTATGYDPRYLWNLTVAGVWEFIVGIGYYSTWDTPDGIFNEAVVLILAFVWGFGGYPLQHEVAKNIKLVMRIIQGLPVRKR